MRFNRVSKILQIIPRYHYYWFTAFRDWSRKFAASTNQNSKTETKRAWSIAFSRASGNQRISSVSSHWHPVVFYFAVIGCCGYFVLV